MASATGARSLRKAVWTLRWEQACTRSTYFGVLALTQSSAWGRTGLRQRILHETKVFDRDVDVRYAVPKWLRTALERCRLEPLLPLFRGGPTLVVYGNDGDAWLCVTRHTEQIIPGAILVGARIGSESVVTRSVLKKLQPFQHYGECLVGLLEQPIEQLTEPLTRTMFALDETLSREAHLLSS